MINMEKGWILRAFQQGVVARKRGRPALENPHPPNSDASVVWDSGWNHGAIIEGGQAVPRGASSRN